MSDRLDNERIEYIERRCDNEGFSLMAKDAVALAREVLASRKLIADLRARHTPDSEQEEEPQNPTDRHHHRQGAHMSGPYYTILVLGRWQVRGGRGCHTHRLIAGCQSRAAAERIARLLNADEEINR